MSPSKKAILFPALITLAVTTTSPGFTDLIKVVLISLFLYNCQLKEPTKNHGIVFLENRAKKLLINKTNKA